MKVRDVINKNNINKIICIIFAILSVGGIAYYLTIGFELNTINNIIYGPLFFLYYQLYKRLNHNKRAIIFSIILSIITAVIMIFGAQLERCNDIFWTIVTFAKIFMLIIALIPIYVKIIELCEKISRSKVCPKIKMKNSTFFLTFGILFIFGLMGFLALYPGVYGYDAGYEIMQIQYDDVTITTHFSVLYSYLLYGFVNLGNTLFHSYTIGFAIYSFVQMCIMTYIVTKVCIFCYRITENKKILITSTLFFCVFPLHIIMMVSAAQDTLFCGFIALILIEIYNMSMDTENFWKKIRNPIKFVALELLLCLFRNNGLYIMLVPAVLTVFFVKKYKFRSIALYVIAIALFLIYKGPILNKMNVVETDTLREMSSVPCQQIARSYIYKNEVYTEEEEAILDNIFAYRQGEIFEYYTVNQSISDSIKGTLNEKYVKENRNEVIKLYVNNLIDDPENYVEGFLFNSLGFWYPDKVYPDSRIYHPYIEFEMLEAKKWNERYIEIERHSLFPIYNKVMKFIVEYNYCNKIPVISLLFTCGTYFLLLVFSVLYSIYIKKIRLLYPLSLLLGYYFTLLLSPVCIFRYCYALVLCAPIIISFVLGKNKDIDGK